MTRKKKGLIILLNLLLVTSGLAQSDSSPRKNSIGAGYKQFFLSNEAKAYYQYYWGLSLEYNRMAFNSKKWWLCWELYYSNATPSSRLYEEFSFQSLVFSPGLKWDFTNFVGLMLKVDITLLEDYECLVNGEPCSEDLIYSNRLPGGIRGLLQIPITIPLNSPLEFRISPTYYLPLPKESTHITVTHLAITASALYKF